MKPILAFLVVSFLVLCGPTTAVPQTARETLKDDARVDATLLTEAEKDVVIDHLKAMQEAEAKATAEAAAMKRMEEMLRNDPQLKTDLMSE